MTLIGEPKHITARREVMEEYGDGADWSHYGKFDSPLSNALYNCSLHGFLDNRGDFESSEFNGDGAEPDWGCLAILYWDSQGFISVDTFDTIEAMEEHWQSVNDMYKEEYEPEEEDEDVDG